MKLLRKCFCLSYKAEFTTLLFLLSYCTRIVSFSVAVVSDFRNALETICNYPHYNNVDSEAREILSALGVGSVSGSIQLWWPKAHVGMPGKKCAEAETS